MREVVEVVEKEEEEEEEEEVSHQEQYLGLLQSQEDCSVFVCLRKGQLLLRQEYCHLGNQVSGEISGGIRWSQVKCQVEPHLVAPLPEILVSQHQAPHAELSAAKERLVVKVAGDQVENVEDK